MKFFPITDEKRRAAPLGQNFAGQTAARGHAAALQVKPVGPARKQCAEILHGLRQE